MDRDHETADRPPRLLRCFRRPVHGAEPAAGATAAGPVPHAGRDRRPVPADRRRSWPESRCPPSAGWTSRSTSGSAGPTLLLTSSFSTAKAMTTTSGGAKHGGGFRPCAITGRDRRQIRPRRRPQGTKRKRTIRYLTFKM